MLDSLGQALTGLRVLDLSRVLAGPFCTQTLADLGAEVIKIEDPAGGDETRGWGVPYLSGLSDYFLACNRNKKSLALDLKKPEGLALLKQLVIRSDILIENFRADSRARLGLGAADLHVLNPRLIIATVSGFGPDDPKHRPGYDYVIQGMSGMMAMNGPAAGEPYKFGVAIADILTGIYASTGILAALHAREKSGEGYSFDISLLDCAVAAQANVVQSFLCSGRQPKKQGHAHLQIVPYQLFAAVDGFLILAVGNDNQWQRFCAATNADELASDSRFQTNRSRVENREILVPLIAARIRTQPLKHWQDRLETAGIPHGPVWTFEDLFQSSEAKRSQLRIKARSASGATLDLVRSPLRRDQDTARLPPTLGEHSDEILRDALGLDSEAIARLRAAGVVI